MGKRKNFDFNSIVQNKKIPILTLDERWHELFPEERKTGRIKELEQKVNHLLKTQGKLADDIENMKKLKKTLLGEIIENMDVNNDDQNKSKEKKMDKSKRYIDELNMKIDETSDQLLDIPYKIKEANDELLIESIKYCYEVLRNNRKELDKINDWIKSTREELRRNILLKHDMELTNKLIYANMHDILGAEIIDLFDNVHDNKSIQGSHAAENDRK